MGKASPKGANKSNCTTLRCSDKKHLFDLDDVKGLVNALQHPIAVFAYGDKSKAQNVIVEIERDGKNFLVGLRFNSDYRGVRVNDIRGLFNKDTAEWLNWVSQGKLLWVDKKKIQGLIDKQRINLAEVEYLDLNSVAKIIKNFRNPKTEEQKYSDSPIRFAIGKKRKDDMRKGLLNKLTNASEEQVEQTITEIEKLGEQSKAGGDAKVEKAALHWVQKGTIVLPEDGPKVLEAVKMATAKVST